MIVNENVVPPIPDPLGVSDVDLRVTQELYSSGRNSALYYNGLILTGGVFCRSIVQDQRRVRPQRDRLVCPECQRWR